MGLLHIKELKRGGGGGGGDNGRGSNTSAIKQTGSDLYTYTCKNSFCSSRPKQIHVQHVLNHADCMGRGEKKKAFNIDTSGNDVNIQPQHVFMERTISDIHNITNKEGRYITAYSGLISVAGTQRSTMQGNTVHMYITVCNHMTSWFIGL